MGKLVPGGLGLRVDVGYLSLSFLVVNLKSENLKPKSLSFESFTILPEPLGFDAKA